VRVRFRYTRHSSGLRKDPLLGSVRIQEPGKELSRLGRKTNNLSSSPPGGAVSEIHGLSSAPQGAGIPGFVVELVFLRRCFVECNRGACIAQLTLMKGNTSPIFPRIASGYHTVVRPAENPTVNSNSSGSNLLAPPRLPVKRQVSFPTTP